MRWPLIYFVGMLLLAGADPSDIIVLTPPRAAVAHEAIWLKVTVGTLPRGSLLRVTTEDGQPVGTISYFGTTAGQTFQDYTLPLPKSATEGGVVRLRIEMHEQKGTSRAPKPGEVLDVALVYVPVTN